MTDTQKAEIVTHRMLGHNYYADFLEVQYNCIECKTTRIINVAMGVEMFLHSTISIKVKLAYRKRVESFKRKYDDIVDIVSYSQSVNGIVKMHLTTRYDHTQYKLN